MTIHDEHPFLEPEGDRDPVRRLRGRLGTTVSLWTTGTGRARTGLTVGSWMVAGGEPGHVLALVDPDSDLAEALAADGAAVVNLLEWRHRDLADAFAGVAPAPGGPFRMGTWEESEWGPVLSDGGGWAGVRVATTTVTGWSLLVDTLVEHVELTTEEQPLVHRRGRYQRP